MPYDRQRVYVSEYRQPTGGAMPSAPQNASCIIPIDFLIALNSAPE